MVAVTLKAIIKSESESEASQAQIKRVVTSYLCVAMLQHVRTPFLP